MTPGHVALHRLANHAASVDLHGNRVSTTWSSLGSVVSGQIHQRGTVGYIEPLSSSIRRCARLIEEAHAVIEAQLRRLDA